LFSHLKADGLAIDERTCRMLLEDPFRLQSLLGRRLDKAVSTDPDRLKQLLDLMKSPLVLRSCDLLACAYRAGLFEGELTNSKAGLQAALWSVKFAGCAVSGSEIEEFVGEVQQWKSESAKSKRLI